MASGPSNLGSYISGITILVVCAMKIPALVRRWHDTLLRAACLLLFSAGCLMLLAAPDSLTTLNRLSGISNFAAPVVYVITAAFSGASLLLIIHWRPAPPEQTRRNSHLCVIAYGLIIFAIIVLFWVGNAPVEQLTLFDAYYANTPYIREMILTYLLAQAVANMIASVLCWRWSTEVHGFLRAGLRILAPAYLMVVCFDVLRLIAIAARWTGRNLDFLVDKVSPQFAAPACLLGAVGFAVPLVGPHMAETTRAVQHLYRLTPLWRALEEVPTPGAIRAALPWWRTPPAILLTGRKTALYDAILALAPYCDPAIRAAAYSAALRKGDDESSAAVTADAAMILVARECQRTTPEQPQEDTHPPAWRAKDLIALSRALTSPMVHDLYRQHVPLQKAAHHD
ncbi:DUF6545 domain-containing protein [Streptomyces avermitilis]|uniref:DUF6545 domain-containing protein n=1 Tax=Streptomyces avermitilis TaxID=33903 RepID=UPI0033AA13A4